MTANAAQASEPHAGRHVRARLGDVCFAAVVVIATAIRGHILFHPFAPPGVDPGNWLAFGHGLLGEHVRSGSIVYPPVVPLLVVGAVKLLGPTSGVIAVALLAAVAPATVMYLLLRTELTPFRAAVCAGFLAVAASTGEPAAWGGYPQLLGLALVIAFLTTLHRYWSGTGRRLGYLAGGLFALLAATSYLLIAPAFGSALVLYGVRTRRDKEIKCRPALREALVGAAPGLMLLPVYVPLTMAFFHNLVIGGGNAKPASIEAALHLLFRDWELFWWTALVLALVTPVLLLSRRRERLWELTTAWLAVSALLVVALPSERTRVVYFFPVGVAMAMGCWMQYFSTTDSPNEQRLGRGFVAGMVVALVLESVYALRFFPAQRHFYGLLSPRLVAAVEWVGHHTERRAVIAVSPVRELALGWWIEGLAQRPTLTASRIDLLTYDDERRRAKEANRIFAGPVPNLAAAQRYGADYVFIAKKSERFDVAGFQRVRADLQPRIAYENRDAVVFRI